MAGTSSLGTICYFAEEPGKRALGPNRQFTGKITRGKNQNYSYSFAETRNSFELQSQIASLSGLAPVI